MSTKNNVAAKKFHTLYNRNFFSSQYPLSRKLRLLKNAPLNHHVSSDIFRRLKEKSLEFITWHRHAYNGVQKEGGYCLSLWDIIKLTFKSPDAILYASSVTQPTAYKRISISKFRWPFNVIMYNFTQWMKVKLIINCLVTVQALWSHG